MVGQSSAYSHSTRTAMPVNMRHPLGSATNDAATGYIYCAQGSHVFITRLDVGPRLESLEANGSTLSPTRSTEFPVVSYVTVSTFEPHPGFPVTALVPAMETKRIFSSGGNGDVGSVCVTTYSTHNEGNSSNSASTTNTTELPVSSINSAMLSLGSHPKKRYLACGGADGTVRFFDTQTNEKVRQLDARAAVTAVWMHPSMQHCIVGNANGELMGKRLRVKEKPGEPNHTIIQVTEQDKLSRNTGGVTCIVASPLSSKTLAVSYEDGSVCLWIVDEEITLLYDWGVMHDSVCTGLAFSTVQQQAAIGSSHSAGATLLSVGLDGSVLVYDMNHIGEEGAIEAFATGVRCTSVSMAQMNTIASTATAAGAAFAESNGSFDIVVVGTDQGGEVLVFGLNVRSTSAGAGAGADALPFHVGLERLKSIVLGDPNGGPIVSLSLVATKAARTHSQSEVTKTKSSTESARSRVGLGSSGMTGPPPQQSQSYTATAAPTRVAMKQRESGTNSARNDQHVEHASSVFVGAAPGGALQTGALAAVVPKFYQDETTSQYSVMSSASASHKVNGRESNFAADIVPRPRPGAINNSTDMPPPSRAKLAHDTTARMDGLETKTREGHDVSIGVNREQGQKSSQIHEKVTAGREEGVMDQLDTSARSDNVISDEMERELKKHVDSLREEFSEQMNVMRNEMKTNLNNLHIDMMREFNYQRLAMRDGLVTTSQTVQQLAFENQALRNEILEMRRSDML